MFRPREWKKNERIKRKMIRRVGWYRPADCVGFFPATPRGELNKEISAILEEEGKRIKMSLRSIEMGGVSLEKQLVRKDLKSGEPCGRPGCVLDLLSGGAGGPHNKPSVLYQGTCNLCGELEVTAEYWGETSRTGYHRTLKHQEEVVRRLEGNAFAKHLAIFHPEHEGDITKFTIKVVSSFKKPLPRKKTEAIKIHSTTADHLLNSKAEHHQPALHRVRMSRENEDQPSAGARGGRGGRTGRTGRGGRRSRGGGRRRMRGV